VSGNVYASGIYVPQDRVTKPIINDGGSGVIYLSSATAAIDGTGNWGIDINAPIVLAPNLAPVPGTTSQFSNSGNGGYGVLKIAGGITGTSDLTLAGNHEIWIDGGALNITGTITNTSTGYWNDPSGGKSLLSKIMPA
jgi:hypothetical protein